MANILIVQGVEGKSIYINDYRVAGRKPWGGGQTIVEWNCPDEDILKALEMECDRDTTKQTEGK